MFLLGLTENYVIHKIKEAMTRKAMGDSIAAKEKELEEMRATRKLGEKGHDMLECYNHRGEG
jgi:hypothetical protein